MAVFFLIAIAVGLGNALIAVAAWRVCSRDAKGPRLAWMAGAVVGAAAGAWLTEPQLEVVVERLFGLEGEGAGLAIGFAFWLALPVMTGMGAWLLAEIAGGRSSRPWRAAFYSCMGALLGTAMILVSACFTPLRGEFSLRRSVWELITLSLTSAGAVLGLALERRRAAKLTAGPARS